MIDISSCREVYRRFKIISIRLTRGDENLADGLTKTSDIGKLEILPGTEVDKRIVEKWTG